MCLEEETGIQGEKRIEVFGISRKIIIEYQLWLKEEFSKRVFPPQVHRQRQGLEIDLIIQVYIIRIEKYIASGTDRGGIGT